MGFDIEVCFNRKKKEQHQFIVTATFQYYSSFRCLSTSTRIYYCTKSHQEFIHDSIVELLNTLASILLCMLEHIHTEHTFSDLHTEHVFNDLQ